MLSSEEKDKIMYEETYRNEVAKKLEVKSKFDTVESVIKILQGLAIIAGIWATYYAYAKQNEDKIAREKEMLEQTARQFRQGFYDKQFEFYSEALDATATIATEDTGSSDYNNARKQFYRLFWGRLSIVEDKTVEAKMVMFENLLTSFEQKEDGVYRSDLQQASLALAHAASKYTINVWLDSTERKHYNR